MFILKEPAKGLRAKFEKMCTAYAIGKAVLDSSDISLAVDKEGKQVISHNVDEEDSSYETHEVKVLGASYEVRIFNNLLDRLTELYNRRQFYKKVDKLISDNQSVVVVMCDIDDFKKINSTYGWPIGDEVLKAVGKSLEKGIRIGDCIARWGGEEFMIAFPRVSEEDMIEKLEFLKRKVSEISFSSSRIDDPQTIDDFNVSISMGSAFYKKYGQDKRKPREIFEDLYQSVAVTLANSKRKEGKNTLTTSSGYVTPDHMRIKLLGGDRRARL